MSKVIFIELISFLPMQLGSEDKCLIIFVVRTAKMFTQREGYALTKRKERKQMNELNFFTDVIRAKNLEIEALKDEIRELKAELVVEREMNQYALRC